MTTLTRSAAVLGLLLLGAAIAAASIYVAQIDDAPGAALFGFILLVATWTAAFRTARRKH